ncbi:MAG: NAD(P)H-dependent oxidoreductase subunit E [Gemmatimonadaceae bacterium]|nr:NAD(P)H-dependent oxidoreductase subunit E [Gemmatimonadaceae bacterium]
MSGVVPWSTSAALEIISAELASARAFYGDDGVGATAMLPILHGLQRTFGYVPSDAVPLMAASLNVSKADVRGVISFYHDFLHEAPGRHVVKLCRAEACQANGSERIAAHLAAHHALHPGTTTGHVTLQNVYCLGNCALGPAALVDDDLLAGLDERAADLLVARLQQAPK